MDAESRREQVLREIRGQEKPVSASALAERMGCSRQIIVGDIALLRAQGHDIMATARGYTMTPAPSGRYIGKLACRHAMDQTGLELMTIVEQGGAVLDVVVEHSLYGEITGQLNLSTAGDVEAFVAKLESGEAKLLSELTGGVHLHTVSCRDAQAFEAIRAALAGKNLLYQSN